DAVFLVVWVPQAARTPANYQRALDQAMQKFRAIRLVAQELCPEEVGLATTPDEMERIVESGRLAVAIGLEHGFPMRHDLSNLARFRELGASYLSLTHSAHNDLADTATPRGALGDRPVEHGGVSELGAAAIAEMNRLGMMVDISHGSKQTALDAMR